MQSVSPPTAPTLRCLSLGLSLSGGRRRDTAEFVDDGVAPGLSLQNSHKHNRAGKHNRVQAAPTHHQAGRRPQPLQNKPLEPALPSGIGGQSASQWLQRPRWPPARSGTPCCTICGAASSAAWRQRRGRSRSASCRCWKICLRSCSSACCPAWTPGVWLPLCKSAQSSTSWR